MRIEAGAKRLIGDAPAEIGLHLDWLVERRMSDEK
jgi:hypothetical protein